jgi:uncharacterized protein (TIRG00374 family)
MAVPEPSQSKRKIIVGTLLFVALTAGIFWYQFAEIQDQDLVPTWSGLNWTYGLSILLLLPLEPLCTSARIWIVCQVLQPHVSFWTSVKADMANIGLAMLTPSQTGGGPAQIYMLMRGGASLSSAFTISVLSFLGTLIGLLCIGLYAVIYASDAVTGTLFTAAVWTVTVSATLAIVVAAVPHFFRAIVAPISRAFCRLIGREHRIIDWQSPDAPDHDTEYDRMGPMAGKLLSIFYSYKYDVIRFLVHGKLAFIGVIATTLIFMLSRALMAYLVVRFLGLEAALVPVMKIQIALLFIIYFAPTPGSAGVAEGASLAAMAVFVPVGFAPYYNMLWRFTTTYMSAIIGIVFLVHASLQDGRRAIHAALTHHQDDDDEPDPSD